MPALLHRAAWVEATRPTLQRVVGAENVREVPPHKGYDDVSEFINKYGGMYVFLGVQDAQFVDGRVQPVAGGHGLAVNHNPGFYADDKARVTGVRLHAHVVHDRLTGRLDAPAHPG